MSVPALHDTEARARWHLELGYEEPQLKPGVLYVEGADDDYEGGYLGDLVTCWKCGGEGNELWCIDDICHGLGYCMHGDGDGPCPECGGEGVL